MVPRVDVLIQPGEYSCFFLFFSVSLPMASQGRSLVFSAILIETHSSSAVRSKKYDVLVVLPSLEFLNLQNSGSLYE